MDVFQINEIPEDLRNFFQPVRQIGLEETLDSYIYNLVEVFHEVKRVLKPNGVLWLNLGDSFSGSNKGQNADGSFSVGPKQYKNMGSHSGSLLTGVTPPGMKPKDLMGVPWRVAFALQADGWYLRSDVIEEVELYCPCGCGHVLEERIWRYSQDRDIIWKKTNPMPESVKDRPTRSHEYIFLLSKSPKYYYDGEAIKEPLTRPEELKRKTPAKFGGKNKHEGYGTRKHSGREYAGELNGRNRRSVWTVSTKGFKGAHFATFNTELITPCVLAGAPAGGIVLDPFCGSGTTGDVAMEQGRLFLGIELNPEYADMARERIGDRDWEVRLR